MTCDAPARAVADRGANLRLRVADDDADVADAGVGDRLDAVEQHRLVGDRHELLGAGVGERPEPRALAAAENQSLHVSLPLAAEGAEEVRERAEAGEDEPEVEPRVRRDREIRRRARA